MREAAAVDASLRRPGSALRGPVFGVAEQDPSVGPEWRVLKPMVNGTPQICRETPNGPGGPMAGATRAGLRDFAYRGVRFPGDVRRDRSGAVLTHPGIVLLPACFGVVERERTGWEPALALRPTAHDARRVLYDAMAEMWPMLYRFDESTKALYAKAAEEFRICRAGRLVRTGPDGPEPAAPVRRGRVRAKIHPALLEDGTIIHDG
ncbi:DUF5954 family protein [Streptomyces sp. NPDC048558]|uniref:DUF5954 family protein n=1 Tax=Streptomyces sp. NPDC048558 TaxID=3155759 RepID=UPI00344AC078